MKKNILLLIIFITLFGLSCQTDKGKPEKKCDPQIQISGLNKGFEEILKVTKDDPCANCYAIAQHQYQLCLVYAGDDTGMQLACFSTYQANLKNCQIVCQTPHPPGQPTITPLPPLPPHPPGPTITPLPPNPTHPPLPPHPVPTPTKP